MKKIQFSMGMTTIRLLLVILFATVFATGKIKAADYYWVGGSGSWSDYSNHWATSSGGTSFHAALPSSLDDVYFDGNSFVSPADTLFISAVSTYCKDFNCLAVANNPVFIFQSVLNVNGSLLLSPVINFPQSTYFSLIGGGSITSAGNNLGSITITTSSLYMLNDNLNTSGIIINNGNLNSNGYNIITGDFSVVATSGTCICDFSNSTITCTNFNFAPLPTSATIGVNAPNSTIICSQDFSYLGNASSGTFGAIQGRIAVISNQSTVQELTCSYLTSAFGPPWGASINKLNLNYDATVNNSPNIYGTFSIGSVTISGASQCQLTGGNVTIDSLTINGSNGIIINAGDTLFVNNYLKLNQIPSTLFNLRSSNVAATAFFESPLNLCLDSLRIENINASGNTPFYAGTNSVDLGGNTGWNFSSCATAVGYYWVGGTGNWNDFANHWATASGGTTFHTQNPTPADNVYFDANSFLTAGDTVYLNVSAVYCDTMDWNVQNDPVTHSILNSSVNISGSLIISSATNFHFSSDLGTKIQVNISGDWENNGNFIAGSSIVAFNGTSLQHIGGTNSTIFHEVKVDNINGVQQDMAVIVDDTLFLTSGKFILNGKTLTLNNGALGALTRTAGYLYSEDVPPNYGMINWKIGTTLGIHTFPFINAGGTYIPFVYNHIAGNSDLTVATYGTNFANTPLPTTVININNAFGIDNSSQMVDRYWILNETGTGNSADLTFSYSFIEGAGIGPAAVSQRWDGSNWKVPAPGQTNPLATQNLTPAVTQFNSVWVITSLASTLGNPYYWVGGTGNWNDFANHWATYSGGTTFQTAPPSPLDDVYFDGNSFSSSGQVNFPAGEIYCNSFDCSGLSQSLIFTIDSTNLKCHGSLVLSPLVNFVFLLTPGAQLNIEMLSEITGNIIDPAGIKIPANTFTLNNALGSWQLLNDFISDSINGNLRTDFSLLNGSFNSGNFDIEVNNISTHVGLNQNFELGNSHLKSSQYALFYQDSLPSNVHTSNSNVIANSTIFISGPDFNFNELTTGQFNGLLPATGIHINKATVSSGISAPGLTIDELYGTGFVNISSAPPGLHIKKFTSVSNAGFGIIIGTSISIDTLFFPASNSADFLINGPDTLFVGEIYSNVYSPDSIRIISTYGLPNSSYFSKSNGILCLHDFVIEGIATTGGAQFFAGSGCIDNGNNSGWQFAACTNVSDVWPGDANYDLTANNNDVLNIGLAYGETGPVRAGASNNWVAQPATDWSSFFLSAVNKKHADCDGNGVVDNNDTLAISLNYGLIHPARLLNQSSNQTTAPPLYLVANPDTVTEGDTIEVDIFLGTQTVPVDSIYGIAFTMDFDTSLVDTSYMPFDYTGCWMGTPGVDLLTYTHKLFSEGKVDIALTRTDHLNLGGYGFLGKAGVVIVDNVGARIANTIPYVTLPLSISNVRALTASEFYLTISTNGDNVEIDTSGITGIIHTDNLNEMISVYPNPVKDVLTVNPGKAKINSLEIYNNMGEIVLRKNTTAGKISINTENYRQGIYFLKLITEVGSVSKKFSINK